MKLAHYSVNRPIGITMLMLMIVIFGFVSLSHLPIDLMPEITYPTITIMSSYSNASPLEIETLVTRPIEQAIAAVPGVEEINSTSNEGNSRVRVSFDWGTDLDAATNDIRDRLDRVLGRLPDDMDRPMLRKFDAAAMPILILGASSDLDPVQMLTLIEEQVKYRVERIPGVAALDVLGGRQREIQVNLDTHRMKSLRIDPAQIISRLRSANVNLPAGLIESGNYEFRLRTPGEFTDIRQVEDVVVGEIENSNIRLRDVAQITDHWEDSRSIVRINGMPGVRIMVSKQSGSNTVAVARAVLDELESINIDLPQLGLAPIVDSSKYIERSIDNVSRSAIYGGVLAVIILQFFLGNLASTSIIAIAIPVSIIATFALMYYFQFTLNIMSLGGMALGIGMLVDNSIVVLENIYRYREKGLDLKQAAIKGSSEVAMPVLASTLTTVVIFLPLLFIEGMTGIMFMQLAYVVGFSLFCSLLVSLTMVPMLSSKLLTLNKANGNKHFIRRITEKIINGIIGFHATGLKKVLKHKNITALILGGLVALSLILVGKIGTEFMPAADEGEIRVTIEMERGANLTLVERVFIQAEQIVKEAVPEAETIFLNIGGGWRSVGTNRGSFRIPLVSMGERERTTSQIAAALRERLAMIPGEVRVREGQGLFIMRMGAGDGERVQLQVRGYDIEVADQLADEIERMLLNIEGITDVSISRDQGIPERIIVIDRARAADQRLSVSQVGSFVETMLSGRSAGNFRESGDEFRILVQAQDAKNMTLEEILDLRITNNAGRQVVLRNIATIQEQVGPTVIERRDQERVVNISANTDDRALNFIIDDVRQGLQDIPRPANFSVVFAGDYQEQQDSFRELLFSFLLAIVLVYMVMAVQYESLYDPVIVITTVPLALVGVIILLYFTSTTLNVQSFIGCIMLGGIVVNNSILLIDHINDLRRESDMPLHQAVVEGASNRCRPILMTASTTILGLLPLALGVGEGGEVQAPMARAVIGGLMFSTLISLFVIPMIYVEFDKAFSGKKEESA